MALLLLAIGVIGASGVPGLLCPRRSGVGQALAAFLSVAGSGLGIVQSVAGTSGEATWEIRLPWSVPGGEFHVALDGISAFFLLPIFLVSALGSIYGLSYWKQAEHPANGRKLRLFYGLLGAGMAVLVLARNAVLFLVAWEVMALSAFFLVATEDEEKPVREAAWLYLAAAHLATLCLFAMFALLHSATGSFTLALAPDATLPPGLATAIFLLALAGFGLKAGIMPLHVWLPSAHATAPSHVSALMSGVFIKMGIYGLVRIGSLLPAPPTWWGELLLALGVASGVLGVAFAIGQHDLKRLLAYHSIENIGIIVMGLGLAMVGRSLGRADWVLLGLGGALLHVWNHALFKSLLFLSAGSVIHATHTRDIDHLGGLGKMMPRTAFCFLIGAVAICGLPPLNGFVSELFIYLGLFHTLTTSGGESWASAAFAIPGLALIGSLAVACFVKVYGAVFLGAGRSEHVRQAHEAGFIMVGPMAVLALCCLVIGLAPMTVLPMLEPAIRDWKGHSAPPSLSLRTLANLAWISATGIILILLLVAAAVFLWQRLRSAARESGPTWDCGYAAPSPRMQYTSSSFGQMLVGLFAWALWPRKHEPQLTSLFPEKTFFHSEVPDTVLDRAVRPGLGVLAWLSSWFRLLQQGSIQAYLVYILVILIVLLLWR
jgi:formate hydrogenlyase subunit 3/multisubunit Na+/H+ antiporter MnhD subunit